MALNLNAIKTPGVYIDEVSLLPPGVAPVETAVPAFVGYTEMNPSGDNVPVLITSFLEYMEMFGGPQSPTDLSIAVTVRDTFEDVFTDPTDPTTYVESKLITRSVTANPPIRPMHNLFFAVRHYFANGGSKCYIVSVSTTLGAVSDSDLVDGINALEQEDEPTLIVVPEAYNLSDSGYNNVYSTALNQCNKLKDRFTIIDVRQAQPSPSSSQALADITNFQTNASLGDYGLYGAAYYPYLETTIDFEFDSSEESQIGITYQKVLADGSASLAPGTVGADLGAVTSDLLRKQIETAIRDISIILPPSPAIAGIYARVDNDRGVWKAPANVSVGAIVGPMVKITDTIQDVMNIDPNGGKSVNAIRAITGRGILVWGARTLAGNDNEWRYVSVRRFFNFVEESVKKATYRFVFEPNDANTWVKIRGMIENFLTLQWSLGALQGSKPEQAFFVRVGLGQTMTADDILNGRLIVEIGMAVVRPAEFIILRFMHKLPEA
ncbi:MAG TPA: phage tail sheath C-terminal domain-containing protein [Saprospiraceae bacterium]|nr:phage tail sheath C-terminal domain-containing protein [Saprospiraceae bacterium]HMQ82141.1 phage tail sheath C-terminal domain-containing protein [Saprospiraceae bacterium]